MPGRHVILDCNMTGYLSDLIGTGGMGVGGIGLVGEAGGVDWGDAKKYEKSTSKC